MSNWIHVDHKHLLLAMKEYKKLDVVGTREKFGFKPANRVHMYYGGHGPFEARVLIAVAYSIQHPNKTWLTPKSFAGSEANKYLETVGFEARPIVRTPQQGSSSRLRAVK